jgi:chromosome segregation ATPase
MTSLGTNLSTARQELEASKKANLAKDAEIASLMEMLQFANRKLDSAKENQNAADQKYKELQVKFGKVAAELQRLNNGGGFLGLF